VVLGCGDVCTGMLYLCSATSGRLQEDMCLGASSGTVLCIGAHLYVGGGKRMKMEASPLDRSPYLTWLSIRRGAWVTPSSRACGVGE
jgi:hypothetical protein